MLDFQVRAKMIDISADLLKLFALGRGGMREYLSRLPLAPNGYVLDDEGESIHNPLELIVGIGWSKLESRAFGKTEERFKSMRQLATLLLLMFEQRHIYEYIWFLDKHQVPIT